MLTISLCMIVKNEESTIAACLASAAALVDEIIIVDTGSVDGTLAICRDYGAHIVEFAWNNDFAAARNFGVSLASGDWILWLDADEEICYAHQLKQYLKQCEEQICPCRMIHLYGDDQSSPFQSYKSTAFRLFRNHIGICFKNAIHEQLDLSFFHGSVNYDAVHPLRIRHYGYLDRHLSRKKGRNLEIIKAELEKEPANPWLHYHMAVEYCGLEEYENALQLVNLAILEFISDLLLPHSLLYRLKYHILLTAAQYDQMNGIEKAVLLYPDYVDLHYYHGVYLYNQKQYEQAMQVFWKCLELGEENAHYLIMTGTGSFLAWYYLGRCYEQLGDEQAAATAYRSAVYENVMYRPAAGKLALLQAE